jgi:hypothetical protein
VTFGGRFGCEGMTGRGEEGCLGLSSMNSRTGAVHLPFPVNCMVD